MVSRTISYCVSKKGKAAKPKKGEAEPKPGEEEDKDKYKPDGVDDLIWWRYLNFWSEYAEIDRSDAWRKDWEKRYDEFWDGLWEERREKLKHRVDYDPMDDWEREIEERRKKAEGAEKEEKLPKKPWITATMIQKMEE